MELNRGTFRLLQVYVVQLLNFNFSMLIPAAVTGFHIEKIHDFEDTKECAAEVFKGG